MKTPFKRFALLGIVLAVIMLACVCYVFVRSLFDDHYIASTFSRIIEWLSTVFPRHENEI